MRNGVLVCSPRSEYKNIGDYIQSVAQEQFFPSSDCYVEREALNTFHSDEVTNVIMNGWFMWEPENFPPSEDIRPLFVSFHIVPAISERLLTKESIEYLKKYEPIGTRDLNTERVLKSKGIKCYFSGCLTLTLGNTFKKRLGGDKRIVFCDPYYPIAGRKISLYNPLSYFKSFWFLLKNYKKAKKIEKAFAVESRTVFRYISPQFERLYCAASFYEYYKSAFTDDVLFDAVYITHNVKSSTYSSNDEWMEAARNLVCRYADSKLVITSRIHCALPCLAVETPVIFVLSDVLNGGLLRSGGRFDGLLNLMHVLSWTNNGCVPHSEEMKKILLNNRINQETEVSVRTEYRTIRDNLNRVVESFLCCGDVNDPD